MIERVQVSPGGRAEESASKPELAPWRRGLVLVAVLNGVLATAWITAFDNYRYLLVVYVGVIATVALPLLSRSKRSFRRACLVVAGLLLVLAVPLYFLALFAFWPSAAILLFAMTPLAERRPIAVIVLLSLAVATPWSYAIWVSHLSHPG